MDFSEVFGDGFSEEVDDNGGEGARDDFGDLTLFSLRTGAGTSNPYIKLSRTSPRGNEFDRNPFGVDDRG